MNERSRPPSDDPARPVLVVGASGFLGLSIVRALAESGREVRGLVRSESKGDAVRRQGGVPIRGDILDTGSVGRASSGCGAIVHVAASAGGGPGSPAERVRVEGTRNLLAAARQNRVRRLVIGSGYWVYASSPQTITESSPVDPRGESRINYEAEQVGLASGTDPEVVVVRPGMVYGDGAWFRPIVESLRAGTYQYIADGANRWSFVSLRDTGAGFSRVLERGQPGEVYNLVDGRPAPWREFVDFVADRLGASAPIGISWEQAVEQFGPDVAHHLRADRAVTAAKLEGLGWRPRWREYRSGVNAVLDEMPKS